MNEVMYDHSSILIVGLLFAVLIVAAEVGYRVGIRFATSTAESTKSQINTILRRTPEPVLFLMFMAFILTATLVGFAARQTRPDRGFAAKLDRPSGESVCRRRLTIRSGEPEDSHARLSRRAADDY